MFQLILPFQLDLPLEHPGDPSGVSAGVLSRRVRAQADARGALREPNLESLALAPLSLAKRRKRKVRSSTHE